VTAAAAGILIWVLLFCKRMVIYAIQIYQRYAPESIRSKCRFEPSCSQYMILAIEKYGLMCGIRKGICRLGRCKPGDGGFDEP
jgi:putative membrane protein insertion efficiency factor